MTETSLPTSSKDTDASLTTPIIRIGGGVMGRHLLLRHGLWCTLVAGLAAILLIIIGAIWDLRIIILGLMLIFLVIPMLLSFVYFRYGLTLEYALNTLPHTLTFSHEGILVKTFKRKEEEAESDELITDRTFRYSKAMISGIESDGSGVYICIKSTEQGKRQSHGSLLLPYSAFSPEDYRRALAMIK